MFRARPTYAYGCDQEIMITEDNGFNSKCTMLVITCYASIEEAEEDWIVTYLAPVVQRLDNAIHWVNRYPVDKC